MTLKISDSVPSFVILNRTFVDAVSGIPYEAALRFEGEIDFNSLFKVHSGMPLGMKLSPDGKLIGTPTIPGKYKIKFVSQDNSVNDITDENNIVTLNVVDNNIDNLTTLVTKKTIIKVDWKKREKGIIADKAILRMEFTPTESLNLAKEKWVLMIGNYPVTLLVSKTKRNGNTIFFSNSPDDKFSLNVKGKSVVKSSGEVSLILKIRNAKLGEVYGLENKTESFNSKYLPITLIVGNSVGHSVLPLKGKSKLNQKSILKLLK